MSEAAKPIAVIQGAPTPVVQALIRDFAQRLAATVRVVGVIEEADGGPGDEACGGVRLRSLADERRFEIFQDLGSEAGACRLDAGGVVAACEAVRRDIEAGCDLVVLNKFGKVEADRSGLADAFAEAIAAGTPILTSVSPKMNAAWARFAGPLYVILPADAAQLEAWWRQASKARATAVETLGAG